MHYAGEKTTPYLIACRGRVCNPPLHLPLTVTGGALPETGWWAAGVESAVGPSSRRWNGASVGERIHPDRGRGFAG